MLQIPKQLQEERFRFIKVKPFEKRVWKHCTKELKRTDLTEKERVELYQKLIRPKTPMEKGHKQDKNYSFDNPEFKKYLEVATGYAVLTGVGDLVIVESDSQTISDLVENNLPVTFTVQSRENQPYRKHFYFIIPELKQAIPLGDDKDGNHLGEIQSGRALVTGANSIHAITGKPYKVIVDEPIKEISKKDFFEVFKPYIEKQLENEYVEDYYSDFPEYNISVTDVLDFNTLKEQGEGRWQGSHPVHGSSTGRNFSVFPERNYWRCYRHGTYGGVFSLIAMKHGIIQCEDVKKGCLKGKKWERVLQIARDEYHLEVKHSMQNANAQNNADENEAAKKILLGNQAYLIYEKNGSIAKVTQQRKNEKLDYVYKGKFQPVRRLILDGNHFYEVDFGDNFIGEVPEIISQMKKRGGVLNNFLITDAVNGVLADSGIETVYGHATYGVYRRGNELYYCTDPYPKTDEQKLICNEMKHGFDQKLTKDELQKYADMLQYWDSYEVLPAMSWGIMASFAYVLRKKGVMFQFLWHDSLESDLGKTTVGLIFSSYLWGIPDSSGDSLASAFRVSDTLDSVGGLRVINEAEKIPWRSSVGQILKQAAERPMANKRGTSSGGSEYYLSRAGFIVTSNGFPITSGNDLIRIYKIEFNVDKKKERQENRKISQQLSQRLRKLKPIGYKLVQQELKNIDYSMKTLVDRIENYGDQIVDSINVPIKSNRRVTGFGIMYEGLKAWERVFNEYGINWKAPSIKEFSNTIAAKIEQFTFESKIPPITEFLFWFENYRDTPSGEMKFKKTWDEKNIEIIGDKIDGVVICYPILTEYKRQTKDQSLNNLADIARYVSSISGYPVNEIYHPRRFIVGEKTKRAVFLPESIFEDTETETTEIKENTVSSDVKSSGSTDDIDVEAYSFTVKNVENVVGERHLSKVELQKRLGINNEEHFQKTLCIINAAIVKDSFETSLAIDEHGDYYNNTKNKTVSGDKNLLESSYPKKHGNLVTKGVSTEEKNGYRKGNSASSNGNQFQREKKAAGYQVTPNSGVRHNIETQQQKYHCVQTIDELDKILNNIVRNNVKKIAVDTETTAINVHNAELVGISFSYKPKEAYYVPVGHSKQVDKQNCPKKEALALLKKYVLENTDIEKIGQNIKYDYHIFKNEGITINPVSFDTMLASFVLNPDNKKSLDALAKRYCKYEMQPISELIGKGKKQITFDKVPIDKAVFYAAEDADLTYRVYEKLIDEFENEDNAALKQVLFELEMPLIPVIAEMERNGVMIDSKQLETETKKTHDEIKQLETDIYNEAGEQFNINSTKDLQRIFFEKLQFEIVKKTPKGQPSTDTETLEILSQQHKLPQLLLRYRELNKLYSTYLTAYPRFINKHSGRVHASFNQAGAVSGRFSSSNPNLQNIPAELRKTFVPKNNEYVFLGADYSQMELRILADFSQDKNLIDAFNSGKDVHTLTASRVFNVPFNKVTSKQRKLAKTVNFGIVYGMSAYGLAARTDLSIDEAKKFIDSYFKHFPEVKRYLTKIKGYAVKHGFVFTKFNRRKHLKKVFSKDPKIKKEGLRQAQNIPIQGTGADILKMVMLQLHERLQGFDAALVLTVHDELVFEVHKNDLEAVKQIVIDEMEHIVNLRVPLKIDIGIGSNWYETKS